MDGPSYSFGLNSVAMKKFNGEAAVEA